MPPQKVSLETQGLAGSQGARPLLEGAGSEPRHIPEASAGRAQRWRGGRRGRGRGTARSPRAQGNLLHAGLAGAGMHSCFCVPCAARTSGREETTRERGRGGGEASYPPGQPSCHLHLCLCALPRAPLSLHRKTLLDLPTGSLPPAPEAATQDASCRFRPPARSTEGYQVPLKAP